MKWNERETMEGGCVTRRMKRQKGECESERWRVEEEEEDHVTDA